MAAAAYPGVYIEERPKTGWPGTVVPTSLTAFVGRTAMGPVETPVPVVSFADFERRFGGVSPDSAISWQVKAFFENGGSQALIVRLFAAAEGQDGRASLHVELPNGGTLALAARSPGAWGNRLSAATDMEGITDEAARADGVADRCDLFNLTVELIENGAVGAVETFKTVTLNPAYPALHVANVLSQQSSLVELLDGGTVGSAGASEGSDSAPLAPADYLGDRDLQTGIHALEQVPAFNILCIPPDLDGGDTASEVCLAAAEYCVARRAMLILDPPAAWQQAYEQHELAAITLDRFAAFTREAARNSAVYFPRIVVADPSSEDGERTLPICGFVAGIWAGTDIRRGLWKAPAGVEAVLAGIARLAGPLTDRDNAILNPLGVNGLRDFARIGPVVWGARTLAGADSLADEHKYVPVRRLALHIETWALQNSGWAAFEPNGERLWARLRLQLSSFMADLWRQDAFMGTTSSEAYFVKCDATTTTPADIDAGRVNVVIGFAPMKPAEYVMVLIQQSAAQASE